MKSTSRLDLRLFVLSGMQRFHALIHGMQNLLEKLLLAFLAVADSGGGGLCDCARDSVAIIEVNHYVNSCGEVQLDQIIFWDFSPGLGCYVVRDWRTCKHYSQVPYRTPDGRFQACWRDSRDSGNAMRIVSAGHVMETWTDFDPETANQEKVERNLRVGLSPVKPRKRVKP
jgi:hypothetical protein